MVGMRVSNLIGIRQASAGDIDGICRCLAEAFAAYREEYTKGAFENTVPPATGIASRLASMTILVATEGGETVGTIACARVSGDEGHIRGMAVRPGRHGSGIAQKLLDAAEEQLRRAGCQRVTLDTTSPLRRAIAFYEAAGYRRTGRISDFFGMELIEYEKKLPERQPPAVH
jgi:ribosomal protein S18 acetylase RimI-like enzyme